MRIYWWDNIKTREVFMLKAALTRALLHLVNDMASPWNFWITDSLGQWLAGPAPGLWPPVAHIPKGRVVNYNRGMITPTLLARFFVPPRFLPLASNPAGMWLYYVGCTFYFQPHTTHMKYWALLIHLIRQACVYVWGLGLFICTALCATFII